MKLSNRRATVLCATLCGVSCRSPAPGGDEHDVPDAESSSTTSPPSTSSSDDSDVPSECDCLPEVVQRGDILEPPTCAPILCAVSASCDEEESTCSPESFETDEEQLLCALTALRDRTPGVITWELDIGGGFASSNGYIVMLADGNVITRTAGRTDYVPRLGPALLGAPPAGSVFEACLSDENVLNRFECLDFEPAAPAFVCQS